MTNEEVIGLTKNSIIQPTVKEKKAKIKKILRLEKPNIFKVNSSLLFLILTINQILETKIIKGKSLIIKLGTYIHVRRRGIKILASVFLKILLPQINLKLYRSSISLKQLIKIF